MATKPPAEDAGDPGAGGHHPRRPTGTVFLVFLWLFLLVLLAGTFAAHVWFLPGLRQPPSPAELIRLDRYGRLEAMSDIDLRWYLGKDAAAVLGAVIRGNSDRIDHAKTGVVNQALLEFEVKFTPAAAASDPRCAPARPFDRIRQDYEAGDFAAAAQGLRNFVKGWSPDSQKQAGEVSLFNLMYQLQQLADLQEAQTHARDSLQVPYLHSIFWMRPRGALAEAVLWSIFGTLVNLIVNVAQVRARGRYRTSEVWISLSKIIYGPVLSLVLILWIYFGIIDASVEVRFWLLPLLGFIFGYNTRKTAVLVDHISDKIFTAVGASTKNAGADDDGPGAKSAADGVAAAAQPATLPQLRRMAATVAAAHLTSALIATNNPP